MASRIGTIDGSLHIGNAKAITWHDEPLGTFDETCQCSVKMILADVLVGCISHKHTLTTHCQRTVVRILTACIPRLCHVALTVIHFNARRKQRINMSVVHSHVANVAGGGKVRLQFSTQPIHIDIIWRSNVYAASFHLHGTNLIGCKKTIHTTIG